MFDCFGVCDILSTPKQQGVNMAVNGIKIEIGQKWRTHCGAIVEVIDSYDGKKYPWSICVVDQGASNYKPGQVTGVTNDGSEWAGVKQSDFDLIELVADAHYSATLAEELLTDLGWMFDGKSWVQQIESSALDIQVSGSHYKDLKIQPVEYIEANKLDYFQGNVVKYVTRHRLKNKADDIRKAIHYCHLILELQYSEAMELKNG
jgi:hypothetical protein